MILDNVLIVIVRTLMIQTYFKYYCHSYVWTFINLMESYIRSVYAEFHEWYVLIFNQNAKSTTLIYNLSICQCILHNEAKYLPMGPSANQSWNKRNGIGSVWVYCMAPVYCILFLTTNLSRNKDACNWSLVAEDKFEWTVESLDFSESSGSELVRIC